MCNVTLMPHLYSRILGPSQIVVSLSPLADHILLLFTVTNMIQNVFTAVRVLFVYILLRKIYNLHVYLVSLLNLLFLPPFIMHSVHYKTISTIYVVEPKILHYY
jgi:hypothetical protein